MFVVYVFFPCPDASFNVLVQFVMWGHMGQGQAACPHHDLVKMVAHGPMAELRTHVDNSSKCLKRKKRSNSLCTPKAVLGRKLCHALDSERYLTTVFKKGTEVMWFNFPPCKV